MTGRRMRRAGGNVLVGLLVLLVAGPLAGTALPIPLAPVASAATPDLTLVTAATYQVQPLQARVHVVLAVTVGSHKPDTQTSSYYFDHAILVVQAGAASPNITGLKGAAVTIAGHDAKSTTLRIGFGRRLYGGTSASFTLTFELPDPKGAAGSLIHVGASLVTFPVWSFGTASTPGSSVTVDFPAGYVVTVEAGSFPITGTSPEGGTELATGALSAPLSFYAYVSGEQPPQYVETPAAVPTTDGPILLTMRAWSDDRTWTGRVQGVFAKALPLLRADFGFAWPHSDPVVIQESISRTSSGHAGQYDPSGQLIEVAYWAGDLAIIHEAAHGWLNARVLADRWAVEGFAAWYAGRTLTQLGGKTPAAALTTAQAAAGFPLNAWPAAGAADAASETYGFTASAVLAATIAARAGDTALRQVWLKAADRVGAYQPPAVTGGPSPVPETVDGAPDWRGLLDLLEEATGQSFTDLWQTWVVRPNEAQLLTARTASRASYQQTLAAASGWALPRSIRDALRSWQFTTANTLMAEARAVLTRRADLERLAAANGLTLPPTVRTLFETGSLAGAAAEADRERAAILAIATAAASRTSQSDALSTIGMIGNQPEVDLAAARASLASGHLDVALSSSDRAYRAWSGAWAEGRRRLVFLLAVLATLAVLGPAIWVRTGRPIRLRRRAAV